jgi:hypothetical protein
VFLLKCQENLLGVHVVFTEAIGLFTLPLQPLFTLVVILAIGHQDQVYPKQKQTKPGCQPYTPEHLANFSFFAIGFHSNCLPNGDVRLHPPGKDPSSRLS